MVYCMRASTASRSSVAQAATATVLLVSKTVGRAKAATEFGQYLRKLAEAKGWYTDAELSRATGVDGSMLSKWWSGATQPNLESLRKMAPHLGVRLGDLLVRSGQATPEELGMRGQPPTPPSTPREPLLREVAAALQDESVPQEERDHLRRGMQHAYDLWREWRRMPRERQSQPQ